MSHSIKKFAVVAMARTGTNALMSALRQHPGCHTDFELFHDEHIPGPLGQRFSLEKRDADPVAFLDAASAYRLQQKPGSRFYGFKIFFGQNDTLLNHLINDERWSLIVLKRENILDQYLSLQIATETQIWNSSEGEGRRKTEFNEAAFFRFKAEAESLYESFDKRLKAAGQPFHRLSYSDIRDGQYGALCEFLELPKPHDLTPKFRKQNPTATADKLFNPDEAKAILKRSGLMHFWVD